MKICLLPAACCLVGWSALSTFGEDSPDLKASGTVIESGQTLVFDIGRQQVGTSFVLNLELKNEIGDDLNIKLAPTCGCTSLQPDNVHVNDGEVFRLSASVKIPDEPQQLRVAVNCEDLTLRKSFRIGIIGQASLPFLVEPEKLLVRPKLEEGIEFKIVECFPDVHVSSVRLVSDSSMMLIAENGGTMSLRPAKNGEGIAEEPVVLQITASNGKEFWIVVPVEIAGITKLRPAIVSLRKTSSGYNALLFVNGLERPIGKDSILVTIKDKGKVLLTGNVLKLQMRTERGALVIAEFEMERIEKLMRDGSKDLSVSVSDIFDSWVCSSKLSCFTEVEK